jgi:repressor LexA
VHVTIGYIMTPVELKTIRDKLGLTQQELAEALHTTRVSIARYETGARKIGGAVQVAVRQLLRTAEIPMAGIVAAGLPIEPVPQSESIEVPPSMLRGGETFALRVKGESMKEDGILPGDLVIVRKQATARNGQTVVAIVNREATVKVFHRKERHVELHPANAAMAPLVVRAQDDFRIEGVVIGVIRHCKW